MMKNSKPAFEILVAGRVGQEKPARQVFGRAGCRPQTGGILCWQHNLLAFHDLCDVEIEEVTVENGLYKSFKNQLSCEAKANLNFNGNLSTKKTGSGTDF